MDRRKPQDSRYGGGLSGHLKQEISPEITSTPDRYGSAYESGLGISRGMDSSSWKRAGAAGPAAVNAHKTRQVDWMVHLMDVAQGLMTKLYRLRQILGMPDFSAPHLPENLWKAGVLPDLPKLCLHVAKKFPEHPSKLQLEKVDKPGLDAIHDNAERFSAGLERWVLVLVDLLSFREQALRVILDLSSTVVTLLPQQNPLILHLFMGLFCSFVRVNLMAEKIPRKMILQVYNLAYHHLKGKDFESYHRLVQYVDSYDPPLTGLHEDLNFISPRIGEIIDAVGPTVFLGVDYQRLRTEGFLSPFHPRYPEKLTNSAHPSRAQDLAHLDAYREWVLLGYLVCPMELLRSNGPEIAMAILRETLVLPLFRDEFILIHDEYQRYVLPKIAESRKLAKSGRSKGKEADFEYNQAKQVERGICEVQEIAIASCHNVHREHRMFLKHELGRMILFFLDQPTLLAPNAQMVFSMLAMARSEVVWYFGHVGVMVGKARGNRVVPVDLDISDPSIGFLLNGIDRLIGLVRKHTPAIRGFSLGYLTFSAQRVKSLLGSPGMVALDIDHELRHLFLSVLDSLEKLPKLQGEKVEKVVNSCIDLKPFRHNWLKTMMVVSSARSPINIRHLDKATMATGKESIVVEGNNAFLWSRSVDEIEEQLQQYGSLKLLYYYRQHVSAVFRHTMFGPEGRPQHCCAWLRVARDFPENAHHTLPDELSTFAKDSISYVQALMEAVMGGLEGLLNILDSEGGYGSLENNLVPEQAVLRLNQAGKVIGQAGNNPSTDLVLPGFESNPKNKDSIKMLEAAVQRLVALCSVLNEMEPVQILNHIYIPREYMREHVINNFRSRLVNITLVDGELQRPSILEPRIQRHMSIIHLLEQHVSMDMTRGVREVLLAESFSGKMRDLHPADGSVGVGGDVVTAISDWYMANIVNDINFFGITYSPVDRGFKSTREAGRAITDSAAKLTELMAFVRLFGPYGMDKLDNSLREQLVTLLAKIEVILQSNRSALEMLAARMHIPAERDASLKQLVDVEVLVKMSLQVGHLLSFRSLLTEATAQVLATNTPLIFSLFTDFSNYAPSSIPELPDVLKLKLIAGRIGAFRNQDVVFVQSVLANTEEAGGAVWTFLPYMYVACMTTSIWNSAAFDIQTGGFSNNIHCLARCINSLFAASELVRWERNDQHALEHQQQKTSGQISGEIPGAAKAKHGERKQATFASIKMLMQTFVQCSSAVMLGVQGDNSRSSLTAKLVFLDQLCESSKYLPRTCLEAHIPQSILRSIYQVFFENQSSIPGAVKADPQKAMYSRVLTRNDSPDKVNKYKNLSDLSAGDMVDRSQRNSKGIFSGPILFSSYRKDFGDPGDEPIKGSKKPGLFSGPLDYTGMRKVSFVDGSGVSPATRGNATGKRFMSSRSGPVTYAHN